MFSRPHHVNEGWKAKKFITVKSIGDKAMHIFESSNNNNSGRGNKHKPGNFYENNTLADEIINSERFAQIIGAIVAGKYSWACVLLLVWANYNPMHYIPFRTYKRLIKENLQNNKDNESQEVKEKKSQSF